jgi:UDPglucose 6-dehydrogenase
VSTPQTKKLIGFVGQGWVGKHYADDFERRGFAVVRYSLDPAHAENRERIAACDIVFIAVPTPTTPEGFDDSAVAGAVALVGVGKVAVIKSTVLPHTTEKLQAQYPDRYVMHAPEFLTAATAAYDASHPQRNILGVTVRSAHLAEAVLAVLPPAPYHRVVDAATAALIKYGGNCSFYTRVLFVNTLFELCRAYGVDYEVVREALAADPRIGGAFLEVVHQGGRGAGGPCFVKDFAAYRALVAGAGASDAAVRWLNAAEALNVQLLTESQKSLDFLAGVYGPSLDQRNPPEAGASPS